MNRVCQTLRMLFLAATGPMLAACSGGARQEPPSAVPDRVDRHGEIEVVGHARLDREMNEGGMIASRSWSLRWRGAPLAIETFTGMGLDQPVRVETANAVFPLGDAAVPDLLVHVGDPNNAGVFHVLSQEGGRLLAPAVCKTFAGENEVRVLAGQGAGSAFHGPNYRVLVGARTLLLGKACVYDVASRRAGIVPRLPLDLFAPYAPWAITFSPDGRSVARLAASDGDQRPWMAVTELDGQAWRRLPIDPVRMRFTRFEDIDAEWILHHFAWQRGKDGRDRLVERAGFKPLPRRGSYLANAAQYEVTQVAVDGSDVFADFLARFPGARRLPDRRIEYSGQVERRVVIEGETVVVIPRGFYVALTGEPYSPGKPGDPALRIGLVHRLGDAFDAELAAGRHGALFAAAAE